jgi:hypothetical protein
LNDEWFIGLVNAGTGVLTFTPQGGTLIDNAATKAIAVGGTCFIFTDGTNFWSLGYGLSGAVQRLRLHQRRAAGFVVRTRCPARNSIRSVTC